MARQILSSLIVSVGLLAPMLFASPASAYWQADGRPVGVAGTQQQNPAIAGDNASGALVFWTDNRSGTPHLAMHHVLANGNLDGSYPVQGKQFSNVATTGQYLSAVADGAGGAIAVWQETDATQTRVQIHALRVTSAGAVSAGWPDSSVLVSQAVLNSGASRPVAVSDGAGGVLIAWQQANNDSFGSQDIWAQRITSAGAVAPGWVLGGKVVCGANNNQSAPVIGSDGSSGAVIAWLDLRDALAGDNTPIELFSQRVTSAGAMSWTANGVSLYTGVHDASDLSLFPDGAAGAIFSYSLSNGVTSDVYTQHVNSLGAKQWGAGGTVVCNATLDQQGSQLAADGSGGVIDVWYDSRSTGSGGSMDIYSRDVSSGGSAGWTANGNLVCNATGPQELPHVVADGAGGAVVIWPDYRTNNWDLYAQHLNSSGTPQWTANGVALCLSHYVDITQPVLAISDGVGGALVAWHDQRTIPGIYMARVSASGVTGPTAVTLSNLAAAGSARGVRVNWSAPLDAPASFQVVRSESKGGPFVAVSPVMDGRVGDQDFQFEDLSASPGASYRYKVAYREAGGWSYSPELLAQAPAALLGLRIGGPNPSRGAVSFEWSLPGTGPVKVQILDVQERRVRTLVDGSHDAGSGSTSWDGTSQDGRRTAAGIYFVRLQAGGRTLTRKLIRL